MRIKQDIAAGVLFMACGAVGLWLGSEYEFGVARAMGPGYLPRLLCWGLIGFGTAVAIKGTIESGEAVGAPRWRPILLVLAAVAVFALTVERIGLFLAVLATALLGALAGDDRRWKEMAALALILAATSSLVFVYGLKLPISIFPS